MFAQVGATFFHNNHTVHLSKEITKPLENGKAGLQKHDEHCKLCAIDFYHQALVPVPLSLAPPSFQTANIVISYFNFKQSIGCFCQGRAPPILLS